MNALELADALENEHDPWPRFPAAAELRRLHQFAEDQIGRATAAEAALQMTKATHALKIAAVEAQRDALLEALKMIAGTAPCIDNLMSDKDIARAALAQQAEPVALKHRHEWFRTGGMEPGQFRCIHCGVWAKETAHD